MTTETYGTLDWPGELERTDERRREETNKFSKNFRQTRRQLEHTMVEQMDIEEFRISHVSGSGGDPGVVVRWREGDVPHAVGCDHYTTKRDNIRAIYLWIDETRKRSNRPVVTGDTDFAAARLMPPDGAEPSDPPPHEVLGVAPDASDAVIEAAAKARLGETHPDTPDGDEAAFKRVTRAKEKLLDS